MKTMRGTTVLCVRHEGKVVMAGDGQITLDQTIMKHTARKVRKIYQDRVLAGFTGATADAFTLFAKFEEKLEQYNGNLLRAAVELAKDWRTDRILRRLEALLIVAVVKVPRLQRGVLAVVGEAEQLARFVTQDGIFTQVADQRKAQDGGIRAAPTRAQIGQLGEI